MRKFVFFVALVALLFGCSSQPETSSQPGVASAGISQSKSSSFFGSKTNQPAEKTSISWVGTAPNSDKISTEDLDFYIATIKQRNFKDAEMIRQIQREYFSDITFLQFSKHGSKFLTVNEAGTAKLWDTKSWQQITTVNQAWRPVKVAFSANGQFFAAKSKLENKFVVWDFENGANTNQKNIIPDDFAFSADGNSLAMRINQELRLVSAFATDEVLQTLAYKLPADTNLSDLAFSPDGKYLAAAVDHKVILWDLDANSQQNSYQIISGVVAANGVAKLAFSQDSEFLAVGNNAEVSIINAKIGKLAQKFNVGQKTIKDLVFADDEKHLLLSFDMHSNIEVWDYQRKKLQEKIDNLFSLHTFALSNNGRVLALSGEDSTFVRFKEVNLMKPRTVADISNLIQQEIKAYLSLPLVHKPELPPQKELVKSQFETLLDFNQRIEVAKAERAASLEKLNMEYRQKVEARNFRLEQRKANLEAVRIQFTEDKLNEYFGKPLLKDLKYDAETQTAHGLIYSQDSEYKQNVSFAIGREQAPVLFENPDAARNKVVFKYDATGALFVDQVEVNFSGDQYFASVSDKEFKSESVRVAIAGGEFTTLEQNPNLIDDLRLSTLELRGNVRDDLAGLVASMKAAPIDNKKWLFVFAVENYDEADKVDFAKNSAESFTKAMQKRLGISERNSYVFIDDKATASALNDHLDRFLNNVKTGDSVYFYYSGHGIPDPRSGEAYLLPKDKIVDYVTREDSLKARTVYRKLSDSKAGEVVAFVDACFSGKTDNVSNFKGVAAGLFKTIDIEFDQRKMTILTAGTNQQFSNKHPEQPHRLFSYYLVETLAKEKNLDVNLLHSKVYSKVKDTSWKIGDVYQQEPTKEGKINAAL